MVSRSQSLLSASSFVCTKGLSSISIQVSCVAISAIKTVFCGNCVVHYLCGTLPWIRMIPIMSSKQIQPMSVSRSYYKFATGICRNQQLDTINHVTIQSRIVFVSSYELLNHLPKFPIPSTLIFLYYFFFHQSLNLMVGFTYSSC